MMHRRGTHITQLSKPHWTGLTYYLLEMSTRCLCSFGLPLEAWQTSSEARQLAQGLPLSQRIYHNRSSASLHNPSTLNQKTNTTYLPSPALVALNHSQHPGPPLSQATPTARKPAWLSPEIVAPSITRSLACRTPQEGGESKSAAEGLCCRAGSGRAGRRGVVIGREGDSVRGLRWMENSVESHQPRYGT